MLVVVKVNWVLAFANILLRYLYTSSASGHATALLLRVSRLNTIANGITTIEVAHGVHPPALSTIGSTRMTPGGGLR